VLIAVGVPLIRDFTIPILFGLLAGGFSTFFISAPLYVRFERARRANAKRRAKKAAPKTTTMSQLPAQTSTESPV